MTLKYPEPAIFELIKNVAGGKVYLGRANDNEEAPFVIIRSDNDEDEFDSINSPSSICTQSIQIDSYGDLYSTAKENGLAIKQILNKYKGEVFFGPSSPQDSVKIAGISFQNGLVLQEQINDYPLLWKYVSFYQVMFNQ